MNNTGAKYKYADLLNVKAYRTCITYWKLKGQLQWSFVHIDIKIWSFVLQGLNLLIFFFLRCGPTRAMTSFLRFVDHTQWRTTVGRTPVDKWSARRKDNTQHTQDTDIHVPRRIRTHNLSRQEAPDVSLRPRGSKFIWFYFIAFSLLHVAVFGKIIWFC